MLRKAYKHCSKVGSQMFIIKLLRKEPVFAVEKNRKRDEARCLQMITCTFVQTYMYLK